MAVTTTTTMAVTITAGVVSACSPSAVATQDERSAKSAWSRDDWDCWSALLRYGRATDT